ncbi:hypothetical protein D5086_033515 [Populus alba]|uniref:Uncharacterized protein n=1 Tax=Populus alba TaxID=43335 RepID=A0ACC4AH08_POPAL
MNGGNYFPPVPPACRNDSACRRPNYASLERKCRGGGVPGAAETAAYWRRLRWWRWQRLSSRWFSRGPRPTPSVRLLLFQMLESPLGLHYPKLLHPVFPVAVSKVVGYRGVTTWGARRAGRSVGRRRCQGASLGFGGAAGGRPVASISGVPRRGASGHGT